MGGERERGLCGRKKKLLCKDPHPNTLVIFQTWLKYIHKCTHKTLGNEKHTDKISGESCAEVIEVKRRVLTFLMLD